MGSVSNKESIQLHHFFEKSVDLYPDNIALICNGKSLTYRELEQKANQLAHYLMSQNISRGGIVGILLERSQECYIAILALLKIGVAYVPIEVDYPDDRINHILSDLPFQALLTSSTQRKRQGLNVPTTIVLDQSQPLIAAQPDSRPHGDDAKGDNENLCYIIYTSGSTGKPKGVEITHRSICHYVTTCSDLYTMSANDRVYQGFSLAFDASMEEVWMAFANGSTLVACTDKDTRSGVGLLEFLHEHQISVFSTVPTLLASLDGTASDLRLLILGGEACTANLVNRWMRPGLKIMNTYGPTEATVIATYVECEVNKEISIGKPLPGYSALILDEQLQPVADGVMGELCIGGMGLARGYVNRPDLTRLKFIPSPLNPDELLYRTGDLAYITPNGEIQFAGRVDDQVKLRGFRIELNEIESIIMEYEAINQAVVTLQTFDQPALVAYLLRHKHIEFDLTHFKDFLRSRLPDYMIPAIFEHVEVFPLLSSGKVDRKALPKPVHTVIDREFTAPESELEKQFALIWEEHFKQGPVSVTADFFYELGGHSLLAAKVVSHLRKIPEFASISILDLYQNPSIRQLAVKVEASGVRHKVQEPPLTSVKPPVNKWNYFWCGLGQFFGCLFQYGLSAWQLLIIVLCYAWVTEHQSYFSLESLTLYISLFLFTPLVSAVLTIGIKWLLLGRVKPGQYPLWGWFYFRWWFVQGLQNNIFQPRYITGTPLINLYYRLLGAKIGRHCFIATNNMSIPDMVSMGDRSSIASDVRVLGYIVEDGWLKIGTITIGDDCYVGARSVLSINTVMENDSVLDDMSMLPSGEVIVQNQFFSGSPARKTAVPANHVTTLNANNEEPTLMQIINYGFLHYFALAFVMMLYFASFLPSILILDYFYEHSNYLSTICIGTPLAAITFLLVHFINVCVSKKLIMNKPQAGTYSLYSFYYLRQWMVSRILDVEEIGVLADSLFFPLLLKCLGAKIADKVEMGETPNLIPDFLTIEKGGFVASGVAISWPTAYKGYITYGHAKIGENAFIGNVSLLPCGAEIGTGGLLGCMTMPPVDGRATEPDKYWLGSPPVFLPVREIIGGFPDDVTYNPGKRLYCSRLLIELFRVVLPTTCTLILLCSLFYILDYLLANTSMWTTVLALPFAECGINLAIISALIALKWLVVGRIKPRITPLWDMFIWRNDVREFTYGYYINPHLTDMILGTPFIGYLYRAMGAKIGKRVFINTEGFAEFDLITIGDDVCINKDTLIQTHLYEDRIFKLDHLLIKDGCNVGVGSMVLYNTVMEPNSTLGSFSLLMKGECLPANTRWEGSPAQSSLHSTGLSTAEPAIDNKIPVEALAK